MKKLYMPLAFTACLFLLIVEQAASQTYPEVEPNNSFANSMLLRRYPDTLVAAVSSSDPIDYYQFDLSYYSTTLQAGVGTLVPYMIITNNGLLNDVLTVQIYNGLQGAGLFRTEHFTNIPTGQTVVRSIQNCGTAMDDYYMAVSTAGNFNYRLVWYYSDANPNTEPNDTRSTANSISYSLLPEYRQAIRYQYRGNPDTDTVDYIKTILPAGDYTNVSLTLKGKNNSCLNGQWLQYAAYKNAETIPFQTGYVGNTPAIPSFTEASSDIPMASLQTGDQLTIKVWSQQPFGYTLKFKEEEIVFVDETDDGDYEGYSALILAENTTSIGQLGYHVIQGGDPVYDEFDNPVIDNYDAFSINVAADGELILYVTALNNDCGNGFYFDILDEFNNSISNQDYKEIITWNAECSTTKSAVIRVPAITAGQYIIRLHNGNSGNVDRVSYSFRYQVNAYNSGGSADLEPDYNQSMAKPIVVSQLNKGYVRFIAPLLDEIDFYKTTLPIESSITVYMKATYRGENTVATNFNSLSFFVANNSYTRRIPINRGVTNLVKNTVYLDTFTITAVPQGLVNLRLFSDERYEYEFRYEIEDVLTGPNDTEPNNTISQAQNILQADTTHGRVGYILNGVTDQNDYFRAIIPSDGNLKIYVKATNNDEAAQIGFDWLDFTVLDGRGTSGIIFNKHIVNNDNIPLGATVYDTITLCGLAADTVYFRFNSFQKFQYSFRYEPFFTTVNNSTEPDGNFASSTRLNANQTYHGTVGYEKRGVTDGFDFYKSLFGSNDSLRISFKATNYGCAPAGLRIRLYNKQQAQILTRFIANNAAVPIGAEVTDNIIIPVTAPDSIYLRIESNTAFKYEFTTGPKVPSSFYYLSGDTTVCIGEQIYRAHNITDTNITYNWSLPQGGGTISFNDSTATVNWTGTATRLVRLVLTNSAGNSTARQLQVIVNSTVPTQTPVVFNAARTLSISSTPLGASIQWYRNNTIIAGATATTYYAADSGIYTAKYINDCGEGPASNSFSFPNPPQSQSIQFSMADTITMSPDLKIPVLALASSGMRVFYQKISGPFTIVNDTLIITGAGNLIIKASQPGDDVYSAAPDKFDSIVVVKGTQTISFDSIPNKLFSDAAFALGAVSSSGAGISYTVLTNNATISNGKLTIRGAGIITVRATQAGSSNYLPATPVERSFCVGVRTLTPIAGDAAPCPALYRYTTQKIPGANFVWTLSSGGILTTNNDTAWVQWQTLGNHSLTVKANSICDTTYTSTQTFNVTVTSSVPSTVTGMKPDNNALNQMLPLTLSWIPGSNTVNYDLYLWDSSVVEPTTAFATNLSTVSYTIPRNTLNYNKTYKWKIISKNPCAQTASPTQQFSIIPLPDLMVSEVLAPSTANSGETITVSWKVTNVGPGRTFNNDKWSDGVYFALDTVSNFADSRFWDANSWNSITAQGRPLLLGKKIRPAALDSGESYINSLSFTLPNTFNFNVYVYVIADNGHPNYRILQASVANDTARKQNLMDIVLSPTPDLRVDSVFVPPSAFSGSTINLTYRVKNYGAVTPAGIGWTDSFFISQNPLFDRNQAIPLSLPKTNGSYYPFARPGHLFDNVQLNANDSRTQTASVVIPNFISGNWFIYVKTNANGKTTLYEGPLQENNVGQAPLQIYLTPTPKLTVNNLTVPVSEASTTQKIGVNYSIKNEGFTDNFEKNKGHFLLEKIESCPCNVPTGPNQVCKGLSKFRDSFLLGSSYWVDKIYLSTDPNIFNPANSILVKEVAHGTKFSALQYPDDMSGECSAGGIFNTSNALLPGANFPKDTSIQIPSDLAPGSYYVYIYTNANKDVFEYPGTAQIKRSTLPIAINRPDLVVSSIVSPATATGAQTISIDYQITNNGAGSVFNAVRKDQLYVSSFPNFDVTATLIATKTVSENIAAGSTISQSFSYRLPAATSGARYFYVITNYDSSFRETNRNNNISASAMTMVSAAQPSDLIVSSVQVVDTVFTHRNIAVSYTVLNNGTGTTAGIWKDSLFLSCSPVFSRANSLFVGFKSQSRTTTVGSSYTDTISFVIPKMSYELLNCFPASQLAQGYFFLKTNADTGTYEASAVANNLSPALGKIIANPLVDHTISSYTSQSDSAIVGRNFGVKWVVRNIGYRPDRRYYSSYYDGIYFSPDSNSNASDLLAASYLQYSLINGMDSLENLKQILIPNLGTGNYYLFAKTNYASSILGEIIVSNNTALLRNADGSPKTINVVRPELPDLVDSILSAPASVVAGQPITVIRRTSNRGTGVSYPGSWSNRLSLSKDFASVNNDGDFQISSKNRTGTLLPGQFQDDTITVTIRATTLPGNYVLISEADDRSKMVESNENNNLGFSLLTILEPPVVDLLVQNISHPDTVFLGDLIDTVTWRTANFSTEEAKGRISESVYLSSSESFDSSAVLLGIKQSSIDLNPLQDTALRLSPQVVGVKEGLYNLIVKTDLLDNYLEDNESNNESFSGSPIYVKVRELSLNVTESTTLSKLSKYYKLNIPDSLIGSTILLTLRSNDSLTYNNEMYLAGGYVPSPVKYDYKYEIPNYGNQQIVITDVSHPVYYIEVRTASPNATLQQIELKAVKLPFAILQVQTSSGGNSGNVTVKLGGSLFTTGMRAELHNSNATIIASQVYFVNSTTVFATFNLKSRPLGVYDVVLKKGDTAIALLPSSFTIVPTNNGGLITGSGPNTGAGNGNEPGCDPGAASGLNSQLVVDLVVPPRVLLGRPIILTLNFSNPTNVDISAQTRVLYSDDLRMALTREGVPNGTTSLYLEIAEPGGPPGIIRAGASGTILIYSVAPRTMPANVDQTFKLK